MLRAAQVAGNVLSSIFNYLLAGGSLAAVIVLLVVLNDVIAEKEASYPQLRPISSSSLAKPIFVRCVSVDTPATFSGTALSVSPDGRMIAYWGGSEGDEEPGFFVAPVDDGRGWRVWPSVARHSWSPDSKRILLQARQDALGATGLAVADVSDLNDLKLPSAIEWLVLPPDDAALSSPPVVTASSFTPDGSAVLYVLSRADERASELWRMHLESGQKQRLAGLPREPDKPNIYVYSLSVSPDGTKVSFINSDRPDGQGSATWWVMNVDGISPLPLMRRNPGAGFVRSWQWFPDSRKVIYDVGRGGDASYQPTTLWTMNTDGTKVRQIASSENVEGFALSPKGSWVVYGQNSHLWMADVDSGREEQVTFGDDHESLPAWLPNGDVLYHYKVGSQTALRLLVHADAEDIPGLGDAATAKAP